MKNRVFFLLILLLVLSGCTGKKTTETVVSTDHSVAQNTTQQSEETSLSSAISQESTETTNATSTENSDETKYPKITKALLNGKSWYEGSSTDIENQPRQGFSDDKFHDLFGNKLDYEIIRDGNEQTYSVLDSVRNEVVAIKLKTKIKVNKPTVDGTYRDVFFYLYYKYDGTLMIAQEGISSEESELISFPLQEINIWKKSE